MSRQNQLAWLIIAVIAAVAVCFTVQYDNVRRDNMAENNPPLATDYAGVREYIGARYVPIFANPPEWTDTRGYEPLTIVLHQGNSFTSTQFVPVGADINNPTYWAETGNWNAQIEAYRKEVLTFDERISDNSNGIDANKEAIETNTSAIERNTASIESNTAAINANAAAINANAAAIEDLNAERYTIVLGDSWSDPNSAIPTWLNYYHTDTTIKNYAKSGAGYVHSTNTIIPQQAVQAVADTSFDHSKVEKIIVIAGANDYSEDYLDIARNSNTTFKTLRAEWPDVEIRVGWNWCFTQPNTVHTMRNPCNVANWAKINACQYDWNFMYQLMNYTKSQVYQADGVHPNQFGAQILAAYLMGDYSNQNILSNASSNGQAFMTLNTPAGGTFTNIGTQRYSVRDGFFSFAFNGGTATPPANTKTWTISAVHIPEMRTYMTNDPSYNFIGHCSNDNIIIRGLWWNDTFYIKFLSINGNLPTTQLTFYISGTVTLI